ncbi:hypothetical protein DFH09DRAFT_1311393 [Mycena vulgaris]|nr:hypothetical protein DFH09DRAFT_1311393 [Mycena vulgaris]
MLSSNTTNPAVGKDAPSVRGDLNLLKHTNPDVKLRACDGRVAAHVDINGLPAFITTHASYIPTLPPRLPDKLALRRDMRFGPDDPTLWPQEYVRMFPHLGAMPRKTTKTLREKLGVMWWNPGRDNFVSPQTGHPLVRGLGKLDWQSLGRIASPAMVPPGFPGLTQTLRLGLERLQTLPSTYEQMVLGVTNLQRAYLELVGLLCYVKIYAPRMNDPEAVGGLPDDDCIGVFTSDPRIAQQFHAARLPCWLLRPAVAFHEINILRVIHPQDPLSVDLEINPNAPTIAMNLGTERRMRHLYECAETLPWYRNPLESAGTPTIMQPTPTVIAGPSHSTAIAGPSHSTAIAGPSHSAVAGSSPAAALGFPGNTRQDAAPRRGGKIEKTKRGPHPYAEERARVKAQKAKGGKTESKEQRDKFEVFRGPEMAPEITGWAQALSNVKRGPPPAGEPASLISSQDESRRQLLLYNYSIMCSALLYRLADPKAPAAPLSAQAWRDALMGKLDGQGKPGSQAQARAAEVAQMLGPAMRPCGIQTLKDFPPNPVNVPPTTQIRAREFTWELAEINFRYEFLAVDKRASGLTRVDECMDCLAGGKLLDVDLSLSKKGLVAISTQERLPYLLRMAALIWDWHPKPNTVVLRAGDRKPKHWNPKSDDLSADVTMGEPGEIGERGEIEKLELEVAQHYTQTFYGFFERAAIIPMRLEHEFGT